MKKNLKNNICIVVVDAIDLNMLEVRLISNNRRIIYQKVDNLRTNILHQEAILEAKRNKLS